MPAPTGKPRVRGVNRIDPSESRFGGGPYWRATWIDGHGTQKKRKFPIARYGEKGARELAIAERQRTFSILLYGDRKAKSMAVAERKRQMSGSRRL